MPQGNGQQRGCHINHQSSSPEITAKIKKHNIAVHMQTIQIDIPNNAPLTSNHSGIQPVLMYKSALHFSLALQE